MIMTLLETLPVGPDTAQWPVWSTTARLVVTDPAALPEARAVVQAHLAEVERACSRFRDDSELVRVQRTGGAPTPVSPLLAELVTTALHAASVTEGDVDPTVGAALSGLGYDRDLALIRPDGPAPVTVFAAPDWRQIRLRDGVLTIPPGVQLDLGATAKGFAADRSARLVAQTFGVGVLVSLGGDIATAGPAPAGGWQIRVQDRPGDPACTVAIAAGMALATSSTTSRQWRRDGRTLHHIINPRTGQPVAPVWRTASVAANTCVQANTFSTAALVRGSAAPRWLKQHGWPARLVSDLGRVVTVAGWPRAARPTNDGTDQDGAEQ